MSDNNDRQDYIADESAFMNALDINPDIVAAGSIRVRFERSTPFVEFQAVVPVPTKKLAKAMMAAAGGDEDGEGETDAPDEAHD